MTATASAVLVTLTPTSDLDGLAAIVRDEHLAIEAAAQNVFEHAVEAGMALLAAKERVGHGDWLRWLQRSCDIEKRTAQRYMQIAGARDELAANTSRVTHLSLRGLLAAATKKPARPKKVVTARKAPKQATSFDALFWWSTATPAARRHFLEGVGESGLLAGWPPTWWRLGDIEAMSIGDLALTVQVEALQREIRQRDTVIAGLRRQRGCRPRMMGSTHPAFPSPPATTGGSLRSGKC